jgi:hypothetical protein
MLEIIKSSIVSALFIAGALLFNCSNDTTLAGAGSETTNGIMIAGIVHNADGTPAHKAIVKLLRIDYNVVADSVREAPIIDTTDSLGGFRFFRVDSGNYNVLARSDSSATGLLLRNIQIKKGDSLVTAPSGNLQKTGAIAVDLSGASAASSQYLFIRGTDIYAFVNGRRVVVLDRIPAGIVPAVSFALATGNDSGIIRYNVAVERQDTALVKNAAWKYSQRVYFNTSSSGAGVTKDVYDFPVLIRLSASNFNFSQSRTDGSDIRFTEGDKPFLPFEIERYDPVGELAEVWVKIDTVFGNDTNQTITIYWGADSIGPSSASNSIAVFDTASGFQGVWHFEESLSDSIRDATGNRFNGVATGMTAASIAGGMIGKCRVFDGAASCVIMPNTANGKFNFSQNGNYTISAWVLLDTLDSASYVVVSKGAFQYYLWYTVIYQNAPNWEFVQYAENSGWSCPTHPARAKEWVLLTGVCNGSSQYLYVNGEPADTTIVNYPYTQARDTTTDFIIGRYIVKAGYPPGKLGGYCYYRGKIDEVRACSRSRSAEWIRLCYMNQKTDDKLITFK